MIIVTGATGQLGSQVVDRLLTRVPADQVGVSVRDIAKADALVARGVRVRQGNYSDPGSLANAFEGADQVLVVSSNDTGADALTQHRAAFDAAWAVGARRVVYTSHQASSTGSAFAPMPDHARTEQHLLEQGRPFTALRNGFYASTLTWLIGRALQTGSLVAPADGPVSWTTHADLAEATAVVLAQEGRLDGISPPLTAPDAVDLATVAGLLSELTGRPIKRVVVDDEEHRTTLVEHGVPAGAADFTLGLFRAMRNGEFDVTGPTLEELLGRPATSVRSVLADLVATA